MAGGYAGKMLPGEKAKDFKGTILRLAGYLKPYRISITAAFVMVILSTVFGVLSPAILGSATDVVVAGVKTGLFDYSKLLKILIVLMILYVCSWAFEVAQGRITAIVSQRVIYSLRKEMSEKIDRLPVSCCDSMKYGEIQSRMINDVETVNNTLNSSLSHMITAIIMLAGVLIMMLRISLLMTAAAVIVVPVSMLLMRIVVRKSQRFFKEQQSSMGKVNDQVEEMYSGHTVVKLCGREKTATEQFESYNDELCHASRKAQIISGLVTPATKLIGNIGYVVVCFMGGWLALNGRVSIGQVQAFIQYVGSLNMPVQQVANIANQLQMTAAAAERIFEFLDTEEEEKPWNECPGNSVAVEKTRGHIVFENVDFAYEPDKPVIQDVSFEAEPGQRIAIVGPTGAGKTTIVKLLMRYYELTGGHIFVDGDDITGLSRHQLREKYSMILQDTWLKSDTIRENIRLGKDHATDADVEAAAKQVKIDKLIRSLPDGYDMMINEGATNISAGQKQLLTIARAVLADSPILILDEATSCVDTRTERYIQTAMNGLMKGRTSIVIAHRLSTIRDADCIIVMNNGRIAEKGKHEELLAYGGLYAEMYRSQFEREK